MRKIFTILLLTVAMCFSICGCTASAVGKTETTILSEAKNEDEDASRPHIELEEPEEVKPLYDNDTDYMTLMIRYAGVGDTDALEAAITARNAKIVDQGLGYEQITLEHFLENYEQYAGFSLSVDYFALMKECCMNGDIVAGREAASKRNMKIDTLGLDAIKVCFDELFELSKIITAEAGSYWLPMEWKMMVGEVVLNRVASVEFPDTIEEVIHQRGQYSNANTRWFTNLIPFEDCVEAASRLLNGERLINDGSVVFQSGSRQGSGTYLELYDSYYGYTYLCYSNRPELYE